ncbi:hypothetical protein O77CONTIG1_00482 [Leptolyngbya sp. O-77]|nr:hypothetical protein O77CONTIG1_00482 [Leptolyngbya sp. O-77]
MKDWQSRTKRPSSLRNLVQEFLGRMFSKIASYLEGKSFDYLLLILDPSSILQLVQSIWQSLVASLSTILSVKLCLLIILTVVAVLVAYLLWTEEIAALSHPRKSRWSWGW